MSRSLISLAIIRTNWDRYKKDHIENFVPMVATLFIEKDYKSVGADNITSISKDFKERFGIELPSHPMETVLKRMSREGFLDKSTGEWKPVMEKLTELDITSKSREINRTFESLVESIKELTQTTFEISITNKDVEDGLLSYLNKHDLDILFAANNGTVLPKIKENKKLEYIIGSFIEKSEKSNPEAFKKIVDISIGHALASTILYEDFSIYHGKFKDLNIYFDTPWLFDLLGVKGEGRQKMAKELLDIAKKENATRKVLDINEGEVLTNLDICLEDFVKGRHPEKASRTYKYCKLSNLTESDIRDYLARLENIFTEEYELEIDTVPDYNDKAKFQVDENELYDIIVSTYNQQRIIKIIEEMDAVEKEHIKEIEKNKASEIEEKEDIKKVEKKEEKCTQKKPKEKERENNTIIRDVQSLSGIYRMREGATPRTLKDTKAIFVTTNASLALASRRFEMNHSGTKNSIPSCITDTFLGTLIWLNTPDIAEEITKKKLLADCYALTEPDQGLIKKYLAEVDKLKKRNKITEEQHLLLRTDQSAFNILTSKAYGDARQFTSDLPFEILEQINADMLRDTEVKVYGKIKQTEEERNQEKKKKEDEEGAHALTKKALKKAERDARTTEQILQVRAHSISKIVVYSGMVIITLAIASLMYFQFTSTGWNAVTITIFIVLSIIGIANWVFGFYFLSYAQKLIPKLQHKIYSWFTK